MRLTRANQALRDHLVLKADWPVILLKSSIENPCSASPLTIDSRVSTIIDRLRVERLLWQNRHSSGSDFFRGPWTCSYCGPSSIARLTVIRSASTFRELQMNSCRCSTVHSIQRCIVWKNEDG